MQLKREIWNEAKLKGQISKLQKKKKSVFKLITRVVESGVGGVACFQLESESGVGVGFQNCWIRSRFSKLLESGVGTFVAITDPMFIK